MKPRPPKERAQSADILNLMCARFEAALAEGRVDASLRAHERECERCADFSRELARVEHLIRDATGPIEHMPDAFLDEVLKRADALEGRYGEREPKRWRRRASALLVVSMAAAAVLLAFWAGGAREQLRLVDTPTQVRVTQSLERPAEAKGYDTPEREPSSMKMRALQASQEVVNHDRVTPRVPAATPVPEPVVDIGAEIQVMLREKVTQSEGCPTSCAQAVWVTATVQSDGSLTERSVMSAGGASSAHRCVTRALDQLILAPGVPKTTVSFELTW